MATKRTNDTSAQTDLSVSKTYKIFIGGSFPRTESGRYYPLRKPTGELLANVCLSSRKDFRNAVVAARAAQESWQDRSAFNRSQIIYRIAEMLQQREALFLSELIEMGYTKAKATKEFAESIDIIVHLAGWCDKYTQVYSTVNPVSSSHFNFSLPEPVGVVATVAPASEALFGIVKATIPAIAGGNTVVSLASEILPLSAVSFAEVIATSDVPGGVVNIITGKGNELLSHFANHMDVNALTGWDLSDAVVAELGTKSAENVKRTSWYTSAKRPQPIDLLMHLQEIKTTWHPIERIAGSGSGY